MRIMKLLLDLLEGVSKHPLEKKKSLHSQTSLRSGYTAIFYWLTDLQIVCDSDFE